VSDGIDKAAVLLANLDPARMEAVLERVGGDRGETLRARMKDVKADPKSHVSLRDILLELEAALGLSLDAPTPGKTEPAKAGPRDPKAKPTAKGAAGAAANGGGVDHVVDDSTPTKSESESTDGKPAKPAAAAGDPLDEIRKVAPEKLAMALQGENPRTAALLLNLFDVEQAGAVYKRLPPDLRREVSICFTKQLVPPTEIIRRIARGVIDKCNSLGDIAISTDSAERAKKMATFVRTLPRPDRLELLKDIETKDAAIAQAIRGELYQFDDVLLLEGSSIQKLLGELDTKTLATALKTATEEIRTKILSNLSSRAQETLKDEMEMLGAVGGSKGNEARKAVVEGMQKLDAAGELAMRE
jgi:flagellar motor switch protein FliG